MKRVLISILLMSMVALASDWKTTLEENLLARYELTKTSRFSKERATGLGTVVVLQADGMSTGMLTKVVAGRLKPAGGFIQALGPKSENHTFKSGDRFYITDLRVRDNDIKVILLSVDGSLLDQRGTTVQKNWLVGLQFEYPNLSTMDAETIRADIDRIIPTEAQANTVKTKTIELGQTITDVEATFGKPETIARLGNRTMYGYRTLKVTFMDGKVVDIQ